MKNLIKVVISLDLNYSNSGENISMGGTQNWIVPYSKAPSYTAPRCTDPTDTHFLGGPKFFQIHGFPNVGHYFTPQLQGYKLVPIVKKVTRYFKIHLDSVTRVFTPCPAKVFKILTSRKTDE